MAGICHLFHPWILQYRVCVAGSHLFYDSAVHGCFRRRQGILQQLLWTRSAFPADRKHPGMVAQEGSAKMVIIQMVPSWIPALLHVLLHNYLHHQIYLTNHQSQSELHIVLTHSGEINYFSLLNLFYPPK